MFDLAAFTEALQIVLDPSRILWLLFGAATGLVVGILPGLGGVVGLSLLLPFIYSIDNYAAMAMLIGVGGVVATADTFPSILIGTPGSAGSQATIMDGYPLARKGQAARALSAAFTSSLFGGLIGVFVLTLIVPIARPLVLALGSPELFMLSVFGLSMVGALGGRTKNPFRGLAVAALGLLLGTVGGAPAVAEYRYTFDSLYLFQGVPLVLLSLGFFALPEIVDLLAQGGSIAKTQQSLGAGWIRGLRDTLRHWLLVVRHSILGVLVGFTPGIGSSIVDWLNYGLVIRLSKDREMFGQGDIRGVIAPESANNAKDSGALIPTLLFGIPGSASMAILLGAMTTLSINPGPRLIQERPELVYAIIWSLAIATVVGTAVCFILSRWIARLTMLPFRFFAPFILIALVFGAYTTTYNVGDLVLFFVFGLLGWVLKRGGYPRAPLLIGFVLSPLLERYLGISMIRYGFEWLVRPGVLVLFTCTVLFLGWQIFEFTRRERAQLQEGQ